MEQFKNNLEEKLNIIGHGIDLVENNRIVEILKKHPINFPRKILSKDEILLLEKEKNKVRFIAGRFCAKEAVMKSININFLIAGPCFSEISILKDTNTLQPIIKINKHLEQLIRVKKLKVFKKAFVTISHTKKNTIASVILVN